MNIVTIKRGNDKEKILGKARRGKSRIKKNYEKNGKIVLNGGNKRKTQKQRRREKKAEKTSNKTTKTTEQTRETQVIK